MSKHKELLIELCDNLQQELNQREGEEIHEVELRSGLKPEGYFTSMMHIGTTRTLPDAVRMAWFVEVWVDGECVFRESSVPHKTEPLEIVEGFLITKVLRNIFTFGVMSSKKFIDDFKGGNK
jgi:hypothetical protein